MRCIRATLIHVNSQYLEDQLRFGSIQEPVWRQISVKLYNTKTNSLSISVNQCSKINCIIYDEKGKNSPHCCPYRASQHAMKGLSSDTGISNGQSFPLKRALALEIWSPRLLARNLAGHILFLLVFIHLNGNKLAECEIGDLYSTYKQLFSFESYGMIIIILEACILLKHSSLVLSILLPLKLIVAMCGNFSQQSIHSTSSELGRIWWCPNT